MKFLRPTWQSALLEPSFFRKRGQHRGTLQTWYHCPTGVGEQGKCIRGSPGTWEELLRPFQVIGGDTAEQLQAFHGKFSAMKRAKQ